MTNRAPEHLLDLEEAAQGHDLYRAPGSEILIEQARDQAEASRWIADEAIEWPSAESPNEVADRRQALYDAMRVLEAAIARPSGLADWRMEIESALARLETSLQAHIESVESDDGIFVDILDRSPHLTSHVQTMRDEHRDLVAACHQALSMSADWSSRSLRRRVNILLARLAIHRQTGAELLYDAYNVDIAAGD